MGTPRALFERSLVLAAWATWASLLLGCGEDANTLGVLAAGAGAPPGAVDGAATPHEAAAIDGALQPNFLMGADISSVEQAVAGGATYVDLDGVETDLLTLLRRHGFNAVRLRVFVDPTQVSPNPQGGTFAPYSAQGYCDLAHTLAVAQTVKAAGMSLLVDFHYSDTWADPTKQVKPAAWAGDDLPAMAAALHDYTRSAVSQLVAAGARPDLVQVGNGITAGIELSPGTPLGPTSDWTQLAQLLGAGTRAVHEVDPSIPISVHLDRCGDAASSAAWIDGASSQGVAFDVFGESCYTAYQGQPDGWQNTFSTLAARYPGLKFMIAEYNADSADPSELRRANDIVFALPDHRGVGAFFWEPTESGAWGPGLFTANGDRFTVIAASIAVFDQMKIDYGL